MTATIAEVARRAGVSTATVSRVLSGATNALPDTRDRVLAAVEELDYRPSAIARALKRRETRTFGLLVTDLGNPFYPQLVAAIEAAAHDMGYGIVLANGGSDVVRELEHIDLLAERRVDGMILASSLVDPRHADRLGRAGLPVVLLNSDAPVATLSSARTDHALGAHFATEHLVGLGHRRIGHVSGRLRDAAGAARLAGVRDAMAGIGEPVVVEGDEHVSGGAAAVERLLEAGVTAVVAYNDLTAIGAMRGLRAAGARVPDDVSVVGFDDIEMASWTEPPLTTVRQPIDALGRWAVERLAAAMRGAARPVERAALRPALVVRESTGGPPYGGDVVAVGGTT